MPTAPAILPYRPLPVPDRWTIHAYYTLSPYAPDGSDQILAAGANLDDGTGEVLVLDRDGAVLDRFGQEATNAAFWHTGWWQTWSPDARFVYYQAGSLQEPAIVRRELATGAEIRLAGDMEGAPPNGEPVLGCLMSLLYAAGYGTMVFDPSLAPVPFAARDRHGVFEHSFDPASSRLALSVEEVLDRHPERDRLRALDKEIDGGLTLMLYCIRWSPDGERFLVYFGNHCVVKERGEPKLGYVFCTDRELKDLHLAVDLSFGQRGVHWSWHPDGEHLIGYGPDETAPRRMSLCQVRWDGSDFHSISQHASGGHPSISPADHELLVTDVSSIPGEVVFIDLRSDTPVATCSPGRVNADQEPPGRNPLRVCHHPVFHPSGDRVLCNTLPGRDATLAEIDAPVLR